jgi:hypothetical protein
MIAPPACICNTGYPATRAGGVARAQPDDSGREALVMARRTRGQRSFDAQGAEQVFFKPYRLLDRVFERDIVVFVIADGRRHMQSLLARRRLGA